MNPDNSKIPEVSKAHFVVKGPGSAVLSPLFVHLSCLAGS